MSVGNGVVSISVLTALPLMLKYLLKSQRSVKLCKEVTLFHAGFWLLVLIKD